VCPAPRKKPGCQGTRSVEARRQKKTDDERAEKKTGNRKLCTGSGLDLLPVVGRISTFFIAERDFGLRKRGNGVGKKTVGGARVRCFYNVQQGVGVVQLSRCKNKTNLRTPASNLWGGGTISRFQRGFSSPFLLLFFLGGKWNYLG